MSTSFQQQILNLNKRIENRLNNVCKESLFEISKRIIKATPVDTGFLKSNWFYYSEISVDDVWIKSGDKDGYISTFSAYQNSLKRISFMLNQETLFYGKVHFLTNSVDYAHKIEFGGSPNKSPDGMIRINAKNYSGIVTAVVAKVTRT